MKSKHFAWKLALVARIRNRRRFHALSSEPLQDVGQIDRELTQALSTVREALPEPTPEQDQALGILETMHSVCVNHMKRSSHEELLSEARTVTIGAFLSGIPVVRGAA